MISASHLQMASHQSTRQDAKWDDKEVLELFYNDYDMTMKEMAEALGCSYSTIRYWMEKHGIRDTGEMSK